MDLLITHNSITKPEPAPVFIGTNPRPKTQDPRPKNYYQLRVFVAGQKFFSGIITDTVQYKIASQNTHHWLLHLQQETMDKGESNPFKITAQTR